MTRQGFSRMLVQRQHEFDGLLDLMSLLPLPPGEGRGEGPCPEHRGPLSQATPPHPNPLPGGEGTEGTRQNQLDSALVRCQH